MSNGLAMSALIICQTVQAWECSHTDTHMTLFITSITDVGGKNTTPWSNDKIVIPNLPCVDRHWEWTPHPGRCYFINHIWALMRYNHRMISKLGNLLQQKFFTFIGATVHIPASATIASCASVMCIYCSPIAGKDNMRTCSRSFLKYTKNTTIFV